MNDTVSNLALHTASNIWLHSPDRVAVLRALGASVTVAQVLQYRSYEGLPLWAKKALKRKVRREE